jgi:hypothetical protein
MIKEIKIGGHIFKVLCPYTFKESIATKGQCDSDLNEIRLKAIDGCGNNLAKSTLEVIFIHEILHAVDTVYNNDSLSGDAINHLAEGLYQVLKDNYNFSFLKEGRQG